MTGVSDIQKQIAKYTGDAFATDRPPITRYWDNDNRSCVYILGGADIPQAGVTSYATVGLSDHAMQFKGKPFGTRVELLGACGSAFQKFGNLLATSAFFIINSNWFCAPGVIFPDVVSMHGASVTLSDMYFTYQYLWSDKLSSATIADRTVSWLLAMPISRSETAYAKNHGPDKLEDLFVKADIDIYNLNRHPVV